MALIQQYRDNFELYANELLWIVNTEKQVQQLTFNIVQQKIHKLFDERARRGRVFMYVLKARQEGVSTYSEARIFHTAHMFPNTHAGVIADEVDRAESIFKMTRLFYERLPNQWRPMTRYSSKRELVFENPSKHGRFTDPGLGSTIEVMTAGSSNIGRGLTFNACHLSEFSHYPNGPDMMESLPPTIHNVPGNFAILETTADRAGSFAHEEWLRYKAEFKKSDGRCELLPIFLAWWELPAYARKFSDGTERKEFLHTLDEEERSIVSRFKLSAEQLFWRREQIRVMKGEVDAFRREFPSDDEEAWVFAGVPIFNRKALSEAWQLLPEKVWVGEITSQGDLTKKEEGRLKIFKAPAKERRYVMGVDPSGGSIDEAVIQIVDADTLEQVAEWSGVIGGIELAQYIYPLGLMYGGQDEQALLAIEITGGWGITPMNELQGKYFNQYRWPRFDTLGSPDSSKIGFETNIRTKPLLVEFGEFCFNNNYCKVNSDELLKEMSTFVRDESVGRGSGSAKDNKCMAWLIALFVAGSGRSDLISYRPRPTVQVVETEGQRRDRLYFGRTLDTQCDLDYMAGLDSDDYESAAHWSAF